MTNWLYGIADGITLYLFFMPLLTLFILLAMFVKDKLDLLKLIIDEMFALYVCCVFVLVFFPLPSAQESMLLNGYTLQYIPFKFIFDILRERTLFSILQVVFNVIMMMPLGIYLTIRFGFDENKVILTAFLASLFIELGQYTGLFFTYPGSYRLCDVDDLMCNTLGGYLGYLIASQVIDLIKSITGRKNEPAHEKLPAN